MPSTHLAGVAHQGRPLQDCALTPGTVSGPLAVPKVLLGTHSESVSSLPETQGQHGPRQVQGKHSLLCPVCVRRQPDSFVQMSHLKKKKLAQQRLILRGPSSCWPHTSSLSKELLLGLEATEREREAA